MSTTALPPGPTASAGRPRFFYGWWIVLGAMLAQFAAIGGGLQVAGVFLRPVTEELGWSAGQYALAGSIAYGVGGLMGFIIGPLVDRIGARPLMLVGGIAYGLALLATSRVNAPWQFILCQAVAGGFGQSLSGPLVVNITLSKWFVIRRGWAIAMGSIGISMAGLIAPIGMTQVVDHLGWRDGYVILGIVVAAVLIPVALLMRRQPEDYGLLPDGRDADAAPSATNTAALAELDRDYQNSYTRAEAVRTPGVWLITIGMGFFMAAMTAVLVHGIPFMTDAGLSRTQASVGVAVAGLANLLSKFAWGWSLRRVETRVLFAGAFLSCGVGTLLMLTADALDGSIAVMYLGFFTWGFGFGGGIPLSEYIWARYYGRRYIGAVRSVGVPFGLVFGSSGSVVVAWYFDAYGAYTGAFIGLLGCYAAGAIAILASRQPPPKVRPPDAEPSEDTRRQRSSRRRRSEALRSLLLMGLLLAAAAAAPTAGTPATLGGYGRHRGQGAAVRYRREQRHDPARALVPGSADSWLRVLAGRAAALERCVAGLAEVFVQRHYLPPPRIVRMRRGCAPRSADANPGR